VSRIRSLATTIIGRTGQAWPITSTDLPLTRGGAAFSRAYSSPSSLRTSRSAVLHAPIPGSSAAAAIAAARISSSSIAVYRSVVAIDACPSNSCTARRFREPR